MSIRSGESTLATCAIACALVVRLAGPDHATAQELVWPASPDAARVRHVGILPAAPKPGSKAVPHSPNEEESFWSKSLRFVLGTAPASRARTRRDLVEPDIVRPTGVWATADAVYVADTGRQKVVRIDLGTKAVTALPAAGDVRFLSPVGVAVTKEGTVFVSDSRLSRVYTVDSGGGAAKELSPPPGGWGRPTGLAVGERPGRLYVADTGRHLVHVYGLDGRYRSSFGGRGDKPGELNFPTYLWADAKTGNILVCDSMNFRVQVFNAAGKLVGGFGEAGRGPGYFARPKGVSVDSDGNVYVVDAAMEMVQIFNDRGDLLLHFGTSGMGPGFFSLPGGVFVDGNDRIYVADTHNARVQVFQYLKEGS